MSFSCSMPPPPQAAPEPAPDIEWQIAEGLTPYPDAFDAMQRQVTAIRAGTARETVWLVEHPPLFTAGTSARPDELFNPLGFPTYAAGRGGQWTYHGPGQRTAYVMLDLSRPHGKIPPRDVRCYVHALEEWLIRALDRFNVRGERRAGRVGIWVADRAAGTEAKIGAIIPCGIREHGVTSLHALGIPVTMAEADVALRAAWDAVFGN